MPLIRDQKVFFVDNGESYDDYGILGVIIATEKDGGLIKQIIDRGKNEYVVLKRDWRKLDYTLNSKESRKEFWNRHPEPLLENIIIKYLNICGFSWVGVDNVEFSFGLTSEQEDIIFDRYLNSDEMYIESHDKRIFKVKRGDNK